MAYFAKKTLATVVSQYSARNLHRFIKSQVGLESPLTSTLIDVVEDVSSKALNTVLTGTQGESSLVEYTQMANLEPVVLIEESLRIHPSISKVLMALVNIYTAYYLQAISLTTSINGVSVLSVLERFNPNRQADVGKYFTKKYGQQAINIAMASAHVLPDYKHPEKYTAALENIPNKYGVGSVVNQTVTQNQTNLNTQTVRNITPAGVGTKDAIKKIADIDNLAVGRLVDVSLCIDGRDLHVPVAVRIRPMSVPALIMRELVALGDIKETWTERWHRMRSGELSFWSDWIFQSDRINNKKRLLAMDKDGLYRDMLNRRKNHKVAQAMTGKVSIGAASAFMIVTAQTVKDVEYRTGVPLSNVELRNKVFAENSAMMIIVMDTDWEQITCYTRGISMPAKYTFKEFEGMSKGDGPDITELMKAFMAGSNPRF